jgi:hypothetical protein
MYFVPGVYSVLKIINNSQQALPAFNVGVIIGKQQKGVPLSAGLSSVETGRLTGDKLFLPYTDESDLQNDYGPEGDNQILTYFRYAKKLGAGTIYVGGINPLTPLTGGVIQNATPANAVTIGTQGYGATVNDISITIADSIWTIIPPKNELLLTADSGTGATVSVADVSIYLSAIGQTVYLTDNAYDAPVACVISSVDPVANTITFTADIGASALKANYARIFQPDTQNQEVSPALTTPALLTAWFATEKYLTATVVGSVTLMPATLAKTPIQYLTSAILATSPAASSTDWDNACANFIRWNEEFALVNHVYMRVIGAVTSDSGNHASLSALAVNSRAVHKPLQVVVGCALGDYKSDSTPNPSARAIALNTDGVQFTGFGIDGYDAYLSSAGEMFGIRLANPVNHNQTGDLFVANSVEVAYFQEDPDLAAFTQNGVIMAVMSSTGYKVNQGLTTYQDQTTLFNVNTKQTYLVMLRDLADYKQVATDQILQNLGTNGVTQDTISAALTNLGIYLRDTLQYISSYQLVSITKVGNAWQVEDSSGVEAPTDFIGMTNDIIID